MKIFKKQENPETAPSVLEQGKTASNAGNFFHSKRLKHSGLAVGLTVIVIVAVVLLNFVMSALAARYPMSIDMTKDKAFQLSQQSKDYIAGLEKDVSIKVLASQQTFTGLNDYYAQAAQIIELYGKFSDKIKVEYVDLVQNPQLENQYADLSPSNYDILIICGDQIVKLSPTDLFNVEQSYYGGQIASSKAEQAMTSAIVQVTDENKVKVAVLSGHGEADITDFTGLLTTNNYEIIDHSVVTEDIPDEVSVVILAAPAKDYTVEELSRLDKFLEGDGKSVVYLADAGQPDTPNLDAFLAEWGIKVGSGLTFETNASMVFNQNSFFTIVNYASDRFAGSLISDKIVMTLPYSRPMEKLFDEKGTVKVEELLSFSETAGVMPKDATEDYAPSDEDMVGPFPGLLYATNTSADGKESHVVACGTYSALVSTLLESTSVGNGNYFLNMMDELSHRENNIQIVAKDISGSELGVNTAQVILLGSVFVVIVPLVVLCAGLVIWIRRRHR
ncbi:GldG family protein [Zongyangia hominis]|uniref:GldG family protein n=1 Tax=Zongyangia hominis TaxID=2763677 RepID=A0A926ICJ8_9FIRM|nr:GldG family protein [Zongyangia hominis]MBC8571443.1 GldG family protein [Zongyangia hominis]